MSDEAASNNFTFIDKKFPSIYGKENKEFLIKWSVDFYFYLKVFFLNICYLKGNERQI